MDQTQTISELLTLDQMKERSAPDWVLIVEPEVSSSLEILRGKVAFHSSDRDEVYRKAIELEPGYFAFRCFAEPDPDRVFIL